MLFLLWCAGFNGWCISYEKPSVSRSAGKTGILQLALIILVGPFPINYPILSYLIHLIQSCPVLSYSSSFVVITKDIANWFLHWTNHIFSYHWVATIVIYFPQSSRNVAYTCMQILCNFPEGGMSLLSPSWILLKCWVSVKFTFAQCLKFFEPSALACVGPTITGPLRD